MVSATMKRRVAVIREMWNIGPATDIRIFALALFATVLLGILEPLQALAVQYIVDADSSAAWYLVTILALTLGTVMALKATISFTEVALKDSCIQGLRSKVLDQNAAITTVTDAEGKAFQTLKNRLQERTPVQYSIAGGFTRPILAAVNLSTILVLLHQTNPWFTLFAAVSVMRIISAYMGSKAVEEARLNTLSIGHSIRQTREIAENPAHAMEIRSSGFNQYIGDRIAFLYIVQNRPRWRAQTRMCCFEVLVSLVFLSCYVGAVWYGVHLVGKGSISSGNLVLIVLLLPQLERVAATISDGGLAFAELYQLAKLTLENEVIGSAYTSEEAGGVSQLDNIKFGFQLEDVKVFAKTGEMILDVPNLSIPAGTMVLLVGDNGAGKSTLLNVMLGLRLPDEGTVEFNGRPLTSYNMQDLRKRMTYVPQSYARPNFELREVLQLGSGGVERDAGFLDTTLRAMSIHALLEGSSSPWKLRLGTNRWSGRDLSGGQWQRLALARSMLPDQPVVCCFDEPSSSLDPEFQHDVLRFLLDLGSQVTLKNNGIAILVSHSIIGLDKVGLVIILKDGRVCDIGTPGNLLNDPQSIFAAMLRAQASQFAS